MDLASVYLDSPVFNQSSILLRFQVLYTNQQSGYRVQNVGDMQAVVVSFINHIQSSTISSSILH